MSSLRASTTADRRATASPAPLASSTYLLLASQRPDKLPDNVLTQCDNLLLMRVNSAGDRASLANRFAFVPPELVELSATFGLGETLRAGKISPNPQLARTGPRLTPEGGADIPPDWAG